MISAPIKKPATAALTSGIQQLAPHLSSPQHIDLFSPEDEKGLENLARYIIRACFSQERMVSILVTECPDGVSKVIYTSKDGKTWKTFDALDRLAHLVTHIPERYDLNFARMYPQWDIP